MSVKVEIKLDIESMADFMVYHIYSSIAGRVAIVLGVINVLFALAFGTHQDYLLMFLFLFFSVLIFWAFPAFIRSRVRKKMANSRRINEPVTYEFMEDGVVTTTQDDSGKASWGKFKKAVSKRRVILLYDDQKQAIILPADQLGEQYTAVVDMIIAHMPTPAVRIRRLDGNRPQKDQEE